MALWSSGATWSSNQIWGPSSPAVSTHRNNKIKRSTMKRKYFYPADFFERPEWHLNLAAKLQLYAAALTLPAAEVNEGVADNLYLAYGLGVWINNVREYAISCTSSLDTLARGTGGEAFVFQNCTAPALPTLPVGITEVLPGALDRTFKLVKLIKTRPGYTEAIGLDMGIVGEEAPPPPPPGEVPPPPLTVTAISGTANQNARVKFVKNGHEYVIVECSVNGGAFAELGMSNKSPFIDARPLLVAGQAEVREYRARYYDNGAPSSGWSDVAKVTVGP